MKPSCSLRTRNLNAVVDVNSSWSYLEDAAECPNSFPMLYVNDLLGGSPRARSQAALDAALNLQPMSTRNPTYLNHQKPSRVHQEMVPTSDADNGLRWFTDAVKKSTADWQIVVMSGAQPSSPINRLQLRQSLGSLDCGYRSGAGRHRLKGSVSKKARHGGDICASWRQLQSQKEAKQHGDQIPWSKNLQATEAAAYERATNASKRRYWK